jgi:hypothetical protein
MKLQDRLSNTAAAAGVGALAGLVGTVAMTISSTIEARIRHRAPAMTPAKAVEEGFGLEPVDEQKEKRLSTLAHFGYGTGWGGARGLLAAVGLHGAPAAATHLGMVWTGEQIMLPATGASTPAWQWSAPEIAIDVLHHTVYAAVTSAVYQWLDPYRRLGPRER